MYTEFYIKYNFTKNDIELLHRRLSYSTISEERFLINYPDCINELIKLNLDEKEAKMLLLYTPHLAYLKDEYASRYNNLKLKLLINNKNKIYSLSKLLTISEETLNKKYDDIINLGFTKKDIEKMNLSNHWLFTYSISNFEEHFNFFLKYDIEKKEIIRLFSSYSSGIMRHSIEDLNDKIKILKKFGFDDEQMKLLVQTKYSDIINNFEKLIYFIEVLNKYKVKKDKQIKLLESTFIRKVNINTLENNELFFESKKVNFNGIKKMLEYNPDIISYESSRLNRCYEWFYKKNYNNEEINQILLGNSKIFNHDIKRLQDIYIILASFDINDETIKFIFMNYPRIFESCPDSLKEKFSLLKRLGILEVSLIKPKNLIQGCEKTYLRYLYIFNVLEEEITDKNYGMLYQSDFKPGIDTLRKMYSYKDDMENDIFKRLEKAKENNIKVKCYS